MATDVPLPLRGVDRGSSPRTLQHETAHRPWPLPPGPWLAHQRWEDVLFAFWPVTVPDLRRRVPLSLAIDVHDGLGWVGVVARMLTRVKPHGLPALPGARSPEVSVFACVHVGHHAGVHELVHHAAGRWARLVGRMLQRAPVSAARMAVREREGWMLHESYGPEGELNVQSRATGGLFRPDRGSLEHFLLERYAIFVPLEDGDVREIGIHHRPWTVRPAELSQVRVALGALSSTTLSAPPSVVLRAEPQDVLVWPPRHATWGPEIA